jgi:hypothetical protein
MFSFSITLRARARNSLPMIVTILYESSIRMIVQAFLVQRVWRMGFPVLAKHGSHQLRRQRYRRIWHSPHCLGTSVKEGETTSGVYGNP